MDYHYLQGLFVTIHYQNSRYRPRLRMVTFQSVLRWFMETGSFFLSKTDNFPQKPKAVTEYEINFY